MALSVSSNGLPTGTSYIHEKDKLLKIYDDYGTIIWYVKSYSSTCIDASTPSGSILLDLKFNVKYNEELNKYKFVSIINENGSSDISNISYFNYLLSDPKMKTRINKLEDNFNICLN